MKRIKKKRPMLFLALSLILLMGSTMAYFTDRVSTTVTGEAGTLEISLDDSGVNLLDESNNNILNPGDKRNFEFIVTNEGNKSAEIRTTLKLTCDIPMDSDTSEYELYKEEDVEYREGMGWFPKSGKQPIGTRTISADGKKITYEIEDYTLNGNPSFGDNKREIEDGITTHQHTYPYVLLFKASADNEFQNSNVHIEAFVEASQHRNLEGNWSAVSTKTWQFQNGDSQSAVADRETEQLQDDPSQNEPTNEKDVYMMSGENFNTIWQENFTTAKHVIFTDIKAPEELNPVDVSLDENSAVMAWQDGDTVYISSQRSGRKVIAHEEPGVMFYNSPELLTVDARNLDTSNSVDMSAMFMACPSLQTIDTREWDTSKVKELYGVFAQCSSLTEIHGISDWDTSSAEDLACLFYYCEALPEIDLTSWDVSQVTDFNSTFIGCSSLTSLDLHTWDISKGHDLKAMLSECTSIQVIDLSGWDFDKNALTHSLFSGDRNLEIIYADDWRSKHDWIYRYNIFYDCVKLPNFDASSTSGDKAYPGEGGYFTVKE